MTHTSKIVLILGCILHGHWFIVVLLVLLLVEERNPVNRVAGWFHVLTRNERHFLLRIHIWLYYLKFGWLFDLIGLVSQMVHMLSREDPSIWRLVVALQRCTGLLLTSLSLWIDLTVNIWRLFYVCVPVMQVSATNHKFPLSWLHDCESWIRTWRHSWHLLQRF